MKVLETIGRGILLACAAPIWIGEEVRTIIGARGEVDTLRDALNRCAGERAEARTSAKNAWLQRDTERSRVVRMHDELTGRERMVSEAKAEARGLSHRLKCSQEDAASLRSHVGESQRAAAELQGEVNTARERRDRADESSRELRAYIADVNSVIVREFPRAMGYSLSPAVELLLADVKSVRTKLDVAGLHAADLLRAWVAIRVERDALEASLSLAEGAILGLSAQVAALTKSEADMRAASVARSS